MAKNRVFPLAFGFLLLLVTGCAGQPAEAATTVSFMVFGDPAEQAAFEAVIDGFHAAQSEVQVEIIALPGKSDYMTRLTSDFAAGAPPDVFLLNYRRMAQFHNRGALEPLGPRLTASSTLDVDNYYPVAIDAFSDSGGTLVCIPQNISSQVVYYNTDLFDAANVPYPPDDWDWAEFRQTAMAMTQPDSNGDGEPDQYGLGLEPTIIRVAPFVWQNRGTLVDDFEQPTRLTLDSPAAMEAMEFMMALSRVDQVVPHRTAELIQTHGDRFLSGSIAMYINSRRIVPVMREIAEFNWDVVPLPQGKTQAGILHSDGYCMAAESDSEEAAWAFIEFAIGEEGQKLASQLGRTVPSLINVAESPAFLDPAKPPANAKVWLETADTIRVLPRLQNWVEIERTAGIEFEQVYLGQQSLDGAINNIQQVATEGFVPLK